MNPTERTLAYLHIISGLYAGKIHSELYRPPGFSDGSGRFVMIPIPEKLKGDDRPFPDWNPCIYVAGDCGSIPTVVLLMPDYHSHLDRQVCGVAPTIPTNEQCLELIAVFDRAGCFTEGHEAFCGYGPEFFEGYDDSEPVSITMEKAP